MSETSTANKADKAMGAVKNAFSNATENFKALLKNKNKWGNAILNICYNISCLASRIIC